MNVAQDLRSYRAITNTALVVLIASALLFERSGEYSRIIGSLGALAGVFAIGVYLARVWSSDNERADDEQEQHCDPAQPVIEAAEHSLVSEVIQVRPVEDLLEDPVYVYSVTTSDQSPHDIFADTIVDVVERLCAFDTRYEFTLTPNGEFRIVYAAPGKTSPRGSGRIDLRAPQPADVETFEIVH